MMEFYKYLGCITAVILIYLFVSKQNTTIDEEICRTTQSFYKKWHNCISYNVASYRKNPEAMWDQLGKASDVCEEESTLSRLQIYKYQNRDEEKYHILPSNEKDTSVIVTLGIGLDVSAESKLKQEIKGTGIFYGADPMVENAKVYEPIGQYYPFAVSGKSGISTASVLKNGTYQNENVIHVDLLYFLTEIIDSSITLFDNIWIDAEGGEYSMMPFFLKGGQLDKHGITVCQFNMEVHYPSLEQKKKFRQFIDKLIDDERYVFLKMTTAAGHWRMYFINFDNPVCSRKYLIRVNSNKN